ncbi:MAG: hypothetical protein WAO52_03095 [Prolixibacteraceae bacterium]
MDQKLLIQLTTSDIFRTESDYPYNSDYGGIVVHCVVSLDNKRAEISLTTKFGNQKTKTRKKGERELDDGLNRISG